MRSANPKLARRQWQGALVFAVALLGGCATAAKTTEETSNRLVWPPPPLAARIEFERTLVSEENIGKDTTFSERIVAFLAGEKPPANRIVEPMGLAVSDDGRRIYVSDYSRLMVWIFDLGTSSFRKIGENEPLARPVGLALDAQERLYIVEQARKGVSVFSPAGKRVSFITHESLERPTGLALDAERGRLYVVDTGTSKSTEHNVKIFGLDGTLLGKIGGERGEGQEQFQYPTYAAVDAAGNVYVTDTLNSRVQVFTPEGRYLKTIGERGNAWGMFDKPKGVALDTFGNTYVVDSGWSNVQIFNAKGQVLLFFGGRGPIPGLLKNPTAIAIDKQNRIYVADFLNHRIGVYRLINTKAGDSLLDPRTADTDKGGGAEQPGPSLADGKSKPK